MVVQKGTTSLFKDSVESATEKKIRKKKVLGPESEALGNSKIFLCQELLDTSLSSINSKKYYNNRYSNVVVEL